MKFEEALTELRKGKKIRHLDWDTSFYLSTSKDRLNRFPCTSDLISNCWQVIEEPGKTFPEVFEAFKEGKKISRKEWHPNMYFKRDDRLTTYLNPVDLLSTDWEII